MTELLACAFCGGAAEYAEINKKWVVECQVCIVSTSVPTHGKKTAATYWNRRTITPLCAIPEGYSITKDKAVWEVKKLLSLAWEAIQEAGYEDHSFELKDKIDQYLDESGGVK